MKKILMAAAAAAMTMTAGVAQIGDALRVNGGSGTVILRCRLKGLFCCDCGDL